MDEISRRQQRLLELANEDPEYKTFKMIFEDEYCAFKAHADAQPEDIRNTLWAYAGGGRGMMQRLVDLACENMEFMDEKRGSGIFRSLKNLHQSSRS